MKKILFISYYYPPLKGVGSKRVSHFIQGLNAQHQQVWVMTVDPNCLEGLHRVYGQLSEGAQPLTDPGVIYTPLALLGKPITHRLRKWVVFRALIHFASFPDPQIYWALPTYQRALRLIDTEKPDFVVTTSSPFTAHLIGLMLKKKRSNIRWLVDFRDEWTDNPLIRFPSAIHRWFARVLERQILKRADTVISVSEGILNNFKKKVPHQKYSLIENCYHPMFFKVNATPAPTELTITFTGTIYNSTDPANLILVLEKLAKTGRLPKGHIQLRFVGNNLPQHNDWVDLVFIDHVSQEELLAYKASSDLLLLCISADRPYAYSSKIFDYIASGIPILGLVPPDGAAAKLIEKTQTGFYAPLEDLQQIENLILRLYQKWKDCQLGVQPNWDEVKKYSETQMTSKLLELMETDDD